MPEMDTPSSLGEEGASPDISSIDVDALMQEVESGSSPGSPDSQAPAGGGAGAASQASQQSTPPAGVPQEFEFISGGKTVKLAANDPRLIQWLSQGHAFNQHMATLNQEREALKKEREQWDPIKSRYAEIEDFAAQNPGWIDRVNEEWLKSKGQGVDPNHPIVKELQTLKAQIGDVVKFKQDSEASRLLAQRESEDKALNQEIQSVRDEFKDMDWNQVSPTGQNMELQVLQFAQERGLKSFKDAFLLLNHSRLLERAQLKAKEAVVKEKQKLTKLGLLGETQAPRKGITNAVDIKNKSLDELIREGAEELGVAL